MSIGCRRWLSLGGMKLGATWNRAGLYGNAAGIRPPTAVLCRVFCNSLNSVFSHGEIASPYTRFWHFRSIFRYFWVKMAGILSSILGGMEFGHFAARPGQPELRD